MIFLSAAFLAACAFLRVWAPVYIVVAPWIFLPLLLRSLSLSLSLSLSSSLF